MTFRRPAFILTATIGFVLLVCSRPAWAVPNTFVIHETSGYDQDGYPVQIGRAFAAGTMAAPPQVRIAGQLVPTQVDVKQRWGNGSLKFAVVSFVLEHLPAHGSITAELVPGTAVGNVPPSMSRLLDPAQFNFDATIEIFKEGAAPRSASARQMLEGGDAVAWTEGPIVTTYIAADHTVSRKYDIGFDDFKSFRPIFEIAFWPSIQRVHVRFIGELAYTEALQDVIVDDISLKIGYQDPVTAYSLPTSRAPLTMTTGSRWTKRYWWSKNNAGSGRQMMRHPSPSTITCPILARQKFFPISLRSQSPRRSEARIISFGLPRRAIFTKQAGGLKECPTRGHARTLG